MDELALYGKDTKITSFYVKQEILRILDITPCNRSPFIYILQTVLLKKLPKDRISGVLNVYAVLYGYGTEKNLENALVRVIKKINVNAHYKFRRCSLFNIYRRWTFSHKYFLFT